MSSTYRLLCLAHDPALIIDREWNRPDDATAAAQNIATTAPEHAKCDLLIGRWSGALIEVGCPPRADGRATHHQSWHRNTIWTETSWLRLALIASSTDRASRAELAQINGRCWSATRLYRLRTLLDLNPEDSGD